MAGYHAFLSPSSLDAALGCNLKVWLEQGIPNTSSPAAAEGTAAHELAADCLEQEVDAASFLGRQIEADGTIFTVDEDMAQFTQVYVDYVRALGGVLMVEQKLSIEELTGEVGATGTSDAVAVRDNRLHIVDLKYGRGVLVRAEGNAQLRAYAIAALNQFDLVFDIVDVEVHIVQPRTGDIDSEVMTADELRWWGTETRIQADKILAGPAGLVATPNEKSCRFCRAKASCPALQNHVLTTVVDEFDVIAPPTAAVSNEQLASYMPRLDMIVDWCNAVRAEVERRVFDGQTVPGFKVVAGKRGARQWENEEAAIERLEAVAPAEMYKKKLISPTQAEKLLKKTDPGLWDLVQELVISPAGKAAVVPVSDKRAAIDVSNPADEFIAIEEDTK